MSKIPQDCEQRKTGSRARQIVHYQLNSDHWEYKEETGNDFGRDCIVELSEENQWNNNKIEGQIKGTGKPTIILDGKYISYSMEIKTINYALGSSNAFILFVVDTTNEIVYYQPIQEYFINNPQLLDKLKVNEKTLNIRILETNIISSNDVCLQKLAKTRYFGARTGKLKAIINDDI